MITPTVYFFASQIPTLAAVELFQERRDFDGRACKPNVEVPPESRRRGVAQMSNTASALLRMYNTFAA